MGYYRWNNLDGEVYVMRYLLIRLKNLKKQYNKKYDNAISRLLLADQIIQEQDYIIEKLLEYLEEKRIC